MTACHEAIQDLHRQMHTQVEKPFVANCGCKRFKLHVVAVCGNDAPPQLCRTKCRVKFGQWAFTRHGEMDSFPEDTLCAKCFRGREVTSESSSSSSEGSGGQEG